MYLKVLGGEDINISCVVFSKTPKLSIENRIEYLSAENGQIRFNTAVPSRCRLECGSQIIEESDLLSCHWFDVEPVSNREFTICATESDGKSTIETGVLTVAEVIVQQEVSLYSELFYEARSRKKTPVSGFAVFEKGTCFGIENGGLCDKSGRIIPSNCKITAYWEDKSVKCVSITAVLIPDGRSYYFQTEVKKEKNYLCDNNDFCVLRRENCLQIRNGETIIVFSDNSEELLPGIISETFLCVEGQQIRPELEPWGLVSAGDACVIMERRGRFIGVAANESLYLRVTIYRGISGFCVEIGLENQQTEPRMFTLDGWYLKLKSNSNQREVKYQIDDKWAEVNGNLVEMRCAGDTKTSAYDVYIQDFWQNYPKSIEQQEGMVSIGLMPLIKHENIYTNYSQEDQRKLLYYLDGKSYRMHLGMRKLIRIGFSDSGDAARSLTEPIWLKPDSATLEKSNAFGELLCCCSETEKFDRSIEEGYQMILRQREVKREYGMFNFGDWHGERDVNWGNGEYDLPYAGLVQYLRGAGEKYAQLGLQAAEHMEQIDHVRIHPNKELSGLFFLHTPGHSNYYEGNNDIIWDEYFAHMGHLFTQGLAEWYKITGNVRFRDAVLRCADTLCGKYCTGFDFVTEREPAWVMLVLMSAFELVRDQKYINACHIIVERVAYKQNAETGCIKTMLCFGETERKLMFGGKPFMCGILMSALYRYYSFTKKIQAKQVMEKLAHWLVYEMWDDEAKGFWYTDYFKMRGIHVYPANNMEIVEGLLYSYMENGDRLLYERAKEAFLCATGLEYRENDVGKTFAMRMRFAASTLKMLWYRREENDLSKGN